MPHEDTSSEGRQERTRSHDEGSEFQGGYVAQTMSHHPCYGETSLLFIDPTFSWDFTHKRNPLALHSMDGVTLFGPHIPPEIQTLHHVIEFFPDVLLKKYLRAAFNAYIHPETPPMSEGELTETMAATDDVIKGIEKKGKLKRDQMEAIALHKADGKLVEVIITALFSILSAAVRAKVTPKEIDSQLVAMKCPPLLVKGFKKIISQRREELEQAAISGLIRLPNVINFRWRIDVTISNSVLSRVLRPYILMEFLLSNGERKVVEASVDTFENLRYNVARALKDMQDLEEHPMIASK
eukprot:TRINITY_DN82859_c0_g1_i1.p1 TRINITY_DN82859_c0_g1~~TRINITY_DN82859_c0_g1_i1.p1  ORF type:complete len:296 (+),score=73.29 TRINITY_DN82859_c0_g1_i1:715-1602(+)